MKAPGPSGPVVAQLDVYHSRPVAPTRRVALGDRRLAFDPAPGLGGILIAGIVATYCADMDPKMRRDLSQLISDLAKADQVPQPQLRHRLQTDRVGLTRSRFRLRSVGQQLAFDFSGETGSPTQYILGAVYATTDAPRPARRTILATVRRAMNWSGLPESELLSRLAGTYSANNGPAYAENSVSWALAVLGLSSDQPDPELIRQRFRELLRAAHPDHGGVSNDAPRRIAELTEARRILSA